MRGSGGMGNDTGFTTKTIPFVIRRCPCSRVMCYTKKLHGPLADKNNGMQKVECASARFFTLLKQNYAIAGPVSKTYHYIM